MGNGGEAGGGSGLRVEDDLLLGGGEIGGDLGLLWFGADLAEEAEAGGGFAGKVGDGIGHDEVLLGAGGGDKE